MKKTIYIVSFDDENDKKHYCPTQKSLCELLNKKFNTNKYYRDNIVHLVYRSGKKNRLGVNIQRVNGDIFFKKYIDAYLNTIKIDMDKYENYHTDHIKRLKNRYVLAIENVVLDGLNRGKDDNYIDKQVYLSHPLINISPQLQ